MLDLPHKERHRWVEEISKINKKINASAGVGPGSGFAQAQPLETPPQTGPPADTFRPLPGGGFSWTNPLARRFEILTSDDED